MRQPQTGRAVPLPLRLLYAALTVGILVGLNAWIEGPNFDSSIEGILILVGLGIIQAVALNIVNGFTGQFSLGHIGFYAVGAYVTAAMATYGHDKLFPFLPVNRDSVSLGMSVYPVLFMAVTSGLVAAGLGFVVGMPSLRLRGDYLAIVTLGFAQIVQVILQNLDVVKGNTSFTGITRIQTIGGTATEVTISTPALANFFWVYLFVVIVIAVSFCIRFSNHGLAFMAVRDNEIAASSMGIDTTRYKVTAFMLSAFFTGIAGSLFALNQSQLSNGQFDFTHGVYPVVMVVLGGLGSVSGVAIAAVLLGVLPESLRALNTYQLVVYPLLLILLMLTRPQGIFGQEELSREWLKGQLAAVKGWGRRNKPQVGQA